MKKKFKLNATTALEIEVAKMMNEHFADYEKPEMFMQDLQQGGCENGIVGELIYYADTLPFFERHKSEINSLLFGLLDGTGESCPAALFGGKWDKEDPLALDTTNQNLLAWFAFEETATKLFEETTNN